ncbi:MAG TPA: thiamine pyrophosphate-dependent enzyme [Bacteroidales bacterium]|nr:thiamine pyrophosphate-dependent enzyme [Bacteroidales bacterium]
MKEFRTSRISKTFGKRFDKDAVIADYRLAALSREISLIGRKEVLSGKAKFGIFGDGKEVPQLAMAKVFQEGDWRSGYYRDQTFMMAAGIFSPEEFFAQLYGDTDPMANPGNGGRLMNNHFSTRTLDDAGLWKNLTRLKNSSADISPTAGQMPRLVGLGLASKLFRNDPGMSTFEQFSCNGNEVAFGTIGDASTSEGAFWEAVNAIGVLQIPVAISVWDDEWGISVSNKYQTTKQSISAVLAGFESEPGKPGFILYTARAWDYPALVQMYEEGIAHCRSEHVPVLFHVTEVTQPQGHSTSGSHERYKSPERLEWERLHDCNLKMKEFILEAGIASHEELTIVEEEVSERARQARKTAWTNYHEPIRKQREDFLRMVDVTTCNCAKTKKIEAIKHDLMRVGEPIRKDVISAAKKILRLICDECSNPENSLKANVTAWLDEAVRESSIRYNTYLYSQSVNSALKVQEIKPTFEPDAPLVPGREILRDNFDRIFSDHPMVVAFGEDVGRIGGVNQTMEGLQEKYGEHRVSDTGIRELTIIGQGIGLAMRGLRPIAEIQYFDYLLYALQVISDDLATLQYRTRGGQKAPLIISTRGHRLEGIWHSGSPLSMVINSVRGVHVLVPRNMTQAAGFYNTMLASDEPALIIEPLNGYRLREKRPSNFGKFRIPLGVPEILHEGKDITMVTYGSCVRIAQDAVEQLNEYGISVELIDVQTLLPFDRNHTIVKSLMKTNRIIFFDEDVPGGATAFMMQNVLEEQQGYRYLDAEPRTVTAREHRAAYSTDGDYFSNPNAEDVFDAAYNLMHEAYPQRFPKIF